jgi:hypothetical protein
MTDLNPVDIINGICAIATFLIYFFTALSILFKHIKYKEKKFIYMSLALFFLGFRWLGLSVSFISVLLTGDRLPFEAQVIITNGFPLALLFWLLVFTELFYRHKQKVIIILWAIFISIMEILLFVFLVIDTSILGSESGSFHTRWGPFIMVRMLVNIFVFLVTALKFYHEAIKTDNPEIKLKTRLLLGGIILLIAGGLLYTITGLIVISLILLLFSVIGFYGGLVFPEWIKKLFQTKV